MMEQWVADQQQSNGLGISHGQQAQGQAQLHGHPSQYDSFAADQLQHLAVPYQMQQDMFDSPLEVNRRTLTQEHFDAMQHNGGMVNGSGGFDDFGNTFSGDHDVLNQVFPELHNDFKQQEAFAFPHPVGAPLSSNDSTVPSTISEQSLPIFPSSNSIQVPANLSANSSDWTDSRSSSLHDGTFAHMPQHQQQPAANTTQWQPGQSVPVDFNALEEEFKQAAQARQSDQQHEQPLAWPVDDAYTRRDSSASLLAQSLGSVGIQTPHPPGFKSPPPPSSIATRRQRPKPAALGLASLRSQSYSAGPQPGSPGHIQHQHQQVNVNASQPLRRIRSSQVIGSVAQGRVTKPVPGSAQRSPLNWSFTDALNSPHATRHPSLQSQNLAPPTPMSPSEFPRSEQQRQFAQVQTSSGHPSRHPSISENDSDQVFSNGLPYHASGAYPTQNFTSPPHTPQYYQQQFAQHRIGSNVFMENTPPQSAPASQTCFPSNAFTAPPQAQMQPQSQPQSQMQTMPMNQPQPVMHDTAADQQFQMSNVTFVPSQQAAVSSSGPPPGMPLQFANGVPVVNAAGDIQMAFPAQQTQYMQQQPFHTSLQGNYPMMTSTGGSPTGQGAAQGSKSQELFVHEYTPPDAVKRAATPRKPVDTGYKNYTFSHTGMEHFEKGKKGDAKESSAASSSPASSTATS